MTAHTNIDMTECEEIRRDLFKDPSNIDPELLHRLTLTCLHALKKVDWNEYNEQRYGRKPVALEEVVFAPDLPPCPKPFRSWPEAFVMLFGGLQGLQYEPKHYKLKYVTEHTYQPDSIDPNNDRLIYEIKGVIPTLVDAKKYREVAKSSHVHFIFIFQGRNIICPFSRARKDGSRMTQEEWCKKEGFDYCYVGEETAFRNSDRYKWLVENFGKGLPSLFDQLVKQ